MEENRNSLPGDFSVYIVDDDLDMRRLCAHLLGSVGVTVEVFENAEKFLAANLADREGVLLTDVRMPGISGLELIETLTRRGTTLTMIVYSGYADVPMAVRALKAGAVEFLQKPFNQQELLEKIRHAREISRQVRETRLRRSEVMSHLATLSPREREVFKLIVMGKPNKLVANDLTLSEKTVEIHRANVMRKMEADSFAHLVRMAVLFENEIVVTESERDVSMAK
jgi:two-component system, LuxR family, response regulator FixJ